MNSDIFGSFCGSKFCSKLETYISVLHAFATNPNFGLSESDFGNLLRELIRSPDCGYKLSDNEIDLIKKLVFISNDGQYMDIDCFGLVWKYYIKSILRPRSALLIMNMQNDFVHGKMPGLTETRTNRIINHINALIELPQFEMCIYSLEHHPAHHVSFIDNVPIYERILKPLKSEQDHKCSPVITNSKTKRTSASSYEQAEQTATYSIWDKVSLVLDDKTQQEILLWPVHCVASTWGWQLSSSIHIAEKSLWLHTGTKALGESYSAYWDWEGVEETKLKQCLTVNSITDLYMCGVPTDVSLVTTAIESLNHGLRVVFVRNASAGLDAATSRQNEQLMQANGVVVVDGEKVQDMVEGTDRKPELAFISAINFSQAMKKLHLETMKNSNLGTNIPVPPMFH